MCTVARPPFSSVEPVVDVLHGVAVADPYRWLEDQNSPQTRAWIQEQRRYARAYLDNVPGRGRIRERVRELLDVETYDSFLKSGSRYFFRKRLPGQEQPSIYFREGPDGEDQLLVDPSERGTGDYTAVKPLHISPDGRLLLYEVKQGGERAGIFNILDVANRRTLPDSLPHGYLRGFAFAQDSKSFYYIHEGVQAEQHCRRVVLHHVLSFDSASDREIFCVGEGATLRLTIVSARHQLGFLVYRFLDKIRTDFYFTRMGSNGGAITVVHDADYSFTPRFLPGRILALSDENAPNGKIVEIQPRRNQNPLYFTLVPDTDARIRQWAITANHIIVLYVVGTRTQIAIFDLFGKPLGRIPSDDRDTLRIVASSQDDDELLLERESFVRPIEIVRCRVPSCGIFTWARRSVPFEAAEYTHTQVSFASKDGEAIPMFLVGRSELLSRGTHPVVMTSYGGFGAATTPQFSALIAFLIERGCLFALPSIRGGSEFGASWHNAARRRNRQVAFNDFLSAAEWLIRMGRTKPEKLAIFGGSNSGLLVGVAMTQRPGLFRAILCMVPLLDMLRYQHFDNARVWKEEFGTSDDAEDFRALLDYSPYHAVGENISYPATLIVSGDADQNCNPLHARKMTARLQAANVSPNPIFLDYNPRRGHSPVLPLSARIDALTDRVAFLCDQLGLWV